MGWRKLSRLLAAVMAVAALPAKACSVVDDYVRPSNFELIQIADAIVVATPEAKAGKDVEAGLVFRVEKAVKGTPPQRLEIGMTAFGRPRASNLSELSGSHPEGHAGPCNRMSFARGGRYLLFLRRAAGGGWRQLDYPFSRVNEDYAGEETLWMRTVRRYLDLQATAKPMEQIKRLERLLETGRGLDGEALRPAETADIRDHLSSLSPYKPTAYLLAAYASLERGAVPSHGVRPRSADAEQSSVDDIARLLLGEKPAREEVGLEAQRLRVLTALVEGDHPEARPLFDRLRAEAPDDPARTGLVLRFLARNGAYDRAFHWIETELMDRLPRLDPPAARRLIRDVALVQSGDDPTEGKERWRRDPRSLRAWPELALSLYWYQVREFGEDWAIPFSDAVRTLPHDDYRARPLLTLALAAGYKEGIAEWAVAELRDEGKRRAWESLPATARTAEADPAGLPLQVLLSAWQTEHAPVLQQVFCQSGPRRLALIREVGEYGDGLYQSLIENIAASELSAEERIALRPAMERWQARRRGGGLFGASIAGLLAGERSKGKPIACPAKP